MTESQAISDITKDVDHCLKLIEGAKIDAAKFEGKLDEILATMKEKFSVTTDAQVKRMLKKMSNQREELSNEIKTHREFIREKYDI